MVGGTDGVTWLRSTVYEKARWEERCEHYSMGVYENKELETTMATCSKEVLGENRSAELYVDISIMYLFPPHHLWIEC